MSRRPDTGSSANRLVLLDGMRGIAAIGVMCFHFVGVGGQGTTWLEMAHGRLAVDFFFLLSGFVICRAYEAKLLHGMSWSRFALVRIIRLGPMLWFGILLWLAVEVARSFGHGAPIAIGQLIPALAFAFLNLPDLSGPPLRYFAVLGQRWSLFYELAINLAYAALLRWLSDRILIAIVVVAAIGLLLLDPRWSIHDPAVLLSCGRIGFSFTLGVLIGRLYVAGRLVRIRLPISVMIVVLVLMMTAPADSPVEIVYSAVSVWFVMPLLLIAGCFARVEGAGGRIAHWLGETSYPLYLLHAPLYVLLLPIELRLGVPMAATPWVIMPVILLISAAAGRWIDMPARGRLSRLLLHRAPRNGLQSAP